MGKAKRSKLLRKEAVRPNPVGIPSNRSLELWEAETASEKTTKTIYVQNIIEQVESRLTEDRNNGLNALAGALENGEILQELLGTDILSTVANLLLDDSVMVRHSAAGALRNLSGINANVCETLVSRNVMKPLVNLFKQKYGNDWTGCKGKATANGTFKTDSATEAFVQALHLLANLCAASEQALRIFNEEKLFQMLPRTLDVAKFGLSVAIAGARCLHIVTEENKDSIPNIPEMGSLLLTILNDSDDRGADFTYLQALVAGTVYNLHGCGGAEETTMLQVLQAVGRVLVQDEVKEIKAFSSDVPIEEEGMDTGKGSTEHERSDDLTPEQRTKLESSASKILRIIEAETLAMEILSNLVFVEDEDGETEFVDDSDDDEESMEEDCLQEKVDLPATDFNVQLSQGVRNESLVTKVMSKAKGLPVNVAEILENNLEFGKEIIEKLGNMRSVALLCLQNLLQAFDLESLGGAEQLRDIYNTLAKILPSILSFSNNKASETKEFQEAVTSCLRAVLQKVIDENCEGVVETNWETLANDLQGLLKLFPSADNPQMGTNIVRLVGSFGVLISRKLPVSQVTNSMMFTIGEFLMRGISYGNDIEDLIHCAEALDTIFDVFSEDDYNDVLKELSLLEKLRHLAPHFKKQVRNRRRSLGDSRGVVETARTNLSRFIEYKRDLGC